MELNPPQGMQRVSSPKQWLAGLLLSMMLLSNSTAIAFAYQTGADGFRGELEPFELRFFGTSQSQLALQVRIEQLEKLLMGAIQKGDLQQRQHNLLQVLTGVTPSGPTLPPNPYGDPQTESTALPALPGTSQIPSTPPQQAAAPAGMAPAAAEKDIAKQLTQLEMAMFDKSHPGEATLKRLSRLEKIVFASAYTHLPIALRVNLLSQRILPNNKLPISTFQHPSSGPETLPSQGGQPIPTNGNPPPIYRSPASNYPAPQANLQGKTRWWQGHNDDWEDSSVFQSPNRSSSSMGSTLATLGGGLLSLGSVVGMGYLASKSFQNAPAQTSGAWGSPYGNPYMQQPYMGSMSPYMGGINPYAPYAGTANPFFGTTFGTPMSTMSMNPYMSGLGGAILQSNPVPPGMNMPLAVPTMGY